MLKNQNGIIDKIQENIFTTKELQYEGNEWKENHNVKIKRNFKLY